MKIHEYQAKEILSRYDVRIQRGTVIESPDSAEAAFDDWGGKQAVVKAQIHAGGRGKGGGVKFVTSRQAAREASDAMLGMSLVTHQTGPEGQKVRKIMLCEALDIAQEFYVGVALDGG